MVKEIFLSFKDNILKKAKNPFLGTYTLILLLRNWELIYSIFTFDKGTKLCCRISNIHSHIDGGARLIKELGVNILWTFGAIISTYLLLNISRLIINFYEKIVSPQLYKLIDKSSIVLKEDYNNILSQKSELEKKLDDEREQRVKYQKEIERLETKLSETNLKANKSKREFRNMPIEYADPNADVNARMLTDKITSMALGKKYITISTTLLNNDQWLENKYIDDDFREFLNLGLFIKDKETEGEKHYEITEEGKKVLRILRLEPS